MQVDPSLVLKKANNLHKEYNEANEKRTASHNNHHQITLQGDKRWKKNHHKGTSRLILMMSLTKRTKVCHLAVVIQDFARKIIAGRRGQSDGRCTYPCSKFGIAHVIVMYVPRLSGGTK